MSEEELRKEAVRRRQAGESAEEVAAALGRTSRWVRKWSVRATSETGNQGWAEGRSRAPRTSPTAPRELRQHPRRPGPAGRQPPGPVRVAGRGLGAAPHGCRARSRRRGRSSGSWPEGLARPRRRPAGYVCKGVPYPNRPTPSPAPIHQIDMVGPRHLDGAIEFHALNLVDVGSHAAGSWILASHPARAWWRRAWPRHVVHPRGARGCPVRQPLELPRRHPSGVVAVRAGGGHLLGPRRRTPLHPASRALAQRGGRALQRRVGQELLPHRPLHEPRSAAGRECELRRLPQPAPPLLGPRRGQPRRGVGGTDLPARCCSATRCPPACRPRVASRSSATSAPTASSTCSASA